MIEIEALDVGGGALGNGPDVCGQRFGIAPLEVFIAFAQRFGDSAGHGLASDLGYSLGETVCCGQGAETLGPAGVGDL